MTLLSQMQAKSSKPATFENSGAKPSRKGSNISSGNANIASACSPNWKLNRSRGA